MLNENNGGENKIFDKNISKHQKLWKIVKL